TSDVYKRQSIYNKIYVKYIYIILNIEMLYIRLFPINGGVTMKMVQKPARSDERNAIEINIVCG
ncbi:hypothetical protein, partial [Bacillus thuringiensis]|uniref:hypothetical protein n=1 Tax=Bacillus thuringiensis TaxID=1428 RepID=UPI001E4D3DD7